MPRLTAIVLGSAAGGGVPQWNCRCPVCSLAWAGDPRVKPRTQTGLAISGDGHSWILLNASPDLRAQIAGTPSLQPKQGARTSPIAAVVLTGAEIDQAAGLLNLREAQRFTLFASAPTLEIIGDNPMFDALASETVARRAVAPGERLALTGGVELELFPMPGKMPLYLEGKAAADAAANVGAEIRAGGASLLFVPAAAAPSDEFRSRLARADVLLFDGTLYADDEMIKLGVGEKTGGRMGHISIDGAGGSLAALAGVKARRIYIHINNTNPVLIEGSPERRRVEGAGWEVAYDGMEIVL